MSLPMEVSPLGNTFSPFDRHPPMWMPFPTVLPGAGFGPLQDGNGFLPNLKVKESNQKLYLIQVCIWPI